MTGKIEPGCIAQIVRGPHWDEATEWVAPCAPGLFVTVGAQVGACPFAICDCVGFHVHSDFTGADQFGQTWKLRACDLRRMDDPGEPVEVEREEGVEADA